MKFDIMHFEALGAEATHLENLTEKLKKEGKLPKNLTYVISPLTLQEYLEENDVELPNIITTKTHSKLPEAYVKEGVRKSIITRSAGYDHFEHLQDILNIASLRKYCVDAVAQTAIKFLYCTAGNLNEYTFNTQTFERKKTISFMELNKNRVATVYGVGKIGLQTYKDLAAQGLTVQAVDVRAEELKKDPEYANVNFVGKDEVFENTDIIVNVMNLTKNPESRLYNVGYFSKEYLSKFKKKLLFINVTRGEIAPEAGLLDLYYEGKILGLGLDVFSRESVITEYLRHGNYSNCKDPDILAGLEIIQKAIDHRENFYVQPHQGFNSDIAAKTKAEEAMNHVVYWYENDRHVFKEQLPYYK